MSAACTGSATQHKRVSRSHVLKSAFFGQQEVPSLRTPAERSLDGGTNGSAARSFYGLGVMDWLRVSGSGANNFQFASVIAELLAGLSESIAWKVRLMCALVRAYKLLHTVICCRSMTPPRLLPCKPIPGSVHRTGRGTMLVHSILGDRSRNNSSHSALALSLWLALLTSPGLDHHYPAVPSSKCILPRRPQAPAQGTATADGSLRYR